MKKFTLQQIVDSNLAFEQLELLIFAYARWQHHITSLRSFHSMQ